ncbi:P-II family nitrogen regulator [bacterium]|nr:P-II family nitrogen regulator [bacterium]
MAKQDIKYNLITCIVQRGKADAVWKAAQKAGAGGVTIHFARGKGVRENLGILGIAISPEKEVLQLVVAEKQTDAIFDEIVKAAKLDTPGMGFAFVQEVRRVVGFFHKKKKQQVS